MKTGTVLVIGLALTALVGGTAKASVLWDGDASKGTSVFGASIGTECPTCCEATTPTDSTLGIKVFRFLCRDNGNTKTRCEGSRMRNFAPTNTGTYYFGWKHKWGPLPTLSGKWQVLEQVHLGGAGASGGPVPFGLHVPGDGKMHFQYQNPSGTAKDFHVMSLPLNSWHQFTYHVKMSESESDGWVEFWYDGTMQTLANGSTRYPSAWAHTDADSYWKWGVYRSGSGGPIGDSVAYLASAKAGTTYADVAGGSSPSPTSTPTPSATATPTPTPVPNATATPAPTPTPVPGPTATPAPGGTFSGYYRLTARHSGKALVVQSASTANNAAVIQYTYGGANTNDEWQVLSIGSGYYRIINRLSSKDLTVQSASTADGAVIFQYTYGGTATNDEWAIVDVGSGYYRITNRNSGKSAEVAGGSTSESAAVDQRTYSGATYQQFQLISVP